MFWIVVLAVIGLLVLVFFDSVRAYPLGTTLLVSSAIYFVWRAYTFLTGAPSDDPLIWKILGGTALVMILVAGIGALASRRGKDKK